MSTVNRWTGHEACALRGALRMSIRVFAEHLGLAARTVSKWEAGGAGVVPRPDPQAILDTVLAQAEPDAQEHFAALWAAGDVQAGSGSGPPPATKEGSWHPGAAVTIGDDIALCRGVRGSGSGGARIVSTWTARDMVSVSASYRRAYRSVPASALLAASTAHLSLILSLGPASQPAHSCRLLVRAVGEVAALAAVLQGVDLGRGTEAERFLALAQDAAKENEDSDLAAVVLACRAFLTSFNGGSPTVAADFADAAVQVASCDTTSTTTRGWVAAVSSEHFAVVGAERRSLRRLDEARIALSEPVNDLDWTGFGTFDLMKVTAYEGGDLMRLGRHTEAIARLDEALAGFDVSMRRHRCATLIDRAAAHLASQNIDACCEDATEALTIATETEHQVLARRVHQIAVAVRPSKAAVALRLWTDVMGAGIGQEFAGVKHV